jgi:hypothetical protein
LDGEKVVAEVLFGHQGSDESSWTSSWSSFSLPRGFGHAIFFLSSLFWKDWLQLALGKIVETFKAAVSTFSDNYKFWQFRKISLDYIKVYNIKDKGIIWFYYQARNLEHGILPL